MAIPPAIVERRSDEREVYALINALRALIVGAGSGVPPVNARYWVSTAATGLANGVSMGALGAGVLQQTVAAGIATPSAFLGTQASVLFLGAAGTLAQDNTGFNYDTTTKSLLVNGSQARGVRITVSNTNSAVEAYSHFRMLSDIAAGFAEAGMVYTSSVFTGPQGPNRLVFVGPTAGNTQSFAWQVGGGDLLSGTVIARMHTYRFGTTDFADTTMFTVNPAAANTTGWAMAGGNVGTEYGMIARTGTAVSTAPFSRSSATYVWSSTGPIVLQTNGTSTTAGTPALFIQYLASTSAIPSTVQGGSLSTSATDGFLYISSMAGAPVGTPTTQTGTVPLFYDRTNNRLYAYDAGAAAWKSTLFA